MEKCYWEYTLTEECAVWGTHYAGQAWTWLADESRVLRRLSVGPSAPQLFFKIIKYEISHAAPHLSTLVIADPSNVPTLVELVPPIRVNHVFFQLCTASVIPEDISCWPSISRPYGYGTPLPPLNNIIIIKKPIGVIWVMCGNGGDEEKDTFHPHTRMWWWLFPFPLILLAFLLTHIM